MQARSELLADVANPFASLLVWHIMVASRSKLPKRMMRSISVAAAVFFSTVPFLGAASEVRTLCSDILYVIEQSRSQFAAIQGDTGGEHGDYRATYLLPDAWHCVILEDPEKKSYRCVWKYPYGDERAHNAFHRLVNEMRNCIGNMATESADQSVSHPDFYASYYFQLAGGGASVNLKDKAELMSTLVSIRIDGFTKER